MRKIVAAPPLPREARKLLESFKVTYVKRGDFEGLKDALRGGAEILITVGFRVDAQLMREGRNLKLIVLRMVGAEDVDVEAAEEKGICVANEPEAIDEAVAEHVVGGVIALLKDIVEGHEYVVSGEWFIKGWPSWMRGGILIGRTLGLIGAGRIASLIAQKGKCLGVGNIYYWSRRRKPFLDLLFQARKVSLEEVFKRSEIVVNTLPLTPETEGLVTYDLLIKMPKGAVFVNVGRGRTVNHADLIRVLREREDLKVFLDVYPEEPLKPEDQLIKEFGRSGRVLLTPHLAGYSEESMRVTAILAAMQAKKFMEDGCVWNPLNKACIECRESPLSLESLILSLRT